MLIYSGNDEEWKKIKWFKWMTSKSKAILKIY